MVFWHFYCCREYFLSAIAIPTKSALFTQRRLVFITFEFRFNHFLIHDIVMMLPYFLSYLFGSILFSKFLIFCFMMSNFRKTWMILIGLCYQIRIIQSSLSSIHSSMDLLRRSWGMPSNFCNSATMKIKIQKGGINYLLIFFKCFVFTFLSSSVFIFLFI